MSLKKLHVPKVNSIVGILLTSGVPFLTRQFGEKHIPFSLIGSLGGLFSYTISHGGLLSEFTTCGYTIRFSTYNQVLLLIHVTDDPSLTKSFINSILDQVNYLILTVLGLNALKNCQNADVAKRSTNKIIPALSLLLEKFDFPALPLSAYPVTTFSSSATKPWQEKLSKCLSILDTDYGCVLSKSSVITISSGWSRLPKEESSALITLFISMLPSSGGITNHVIYLPKSSPKSSFSLFYCSYPPYSVFAICPNETTNELFTESLHRSFTISKSQFVVKQSVKDGVRFDSAVLSLVVVKGQAMNHYVLEGGDKAKSGRVLSEALTNRAVLDDLEEGKVIKCVLSLGNNSCYIVGDKEFIVAALFKKDVSFFVMDGLLKEVVDYYRSLK